MKAYRIEAEDGCGVFRSGLVDEMCLFTSYFYIPEGGDNNSVISSEDKWGYVDWDIKAPTPVRPFKDENGLEYEALIPKTYLRKYHHFGHPTLESIKTWWDDTELHILNKLGAKLVEVDVKVSRSDFKQCVYDKRRVRSKKYLDIGAIIEKDCINKQLILESIMVQDLYKLYSNEFIKSVTDI